MTTVNVSVSASRNSPERPPVTPQRRGRELAREGASLWREFGSVAVAASELVNRHPEVPSIQAHRYAAGLSQEHAAARYNEVAGHQTSLGGTTINAWETWARVRGSGSPPSMSSLLVLAEAYGRGPLGIAHEDIAPADLLAEAYERLPPEDQFALRRINRTRQGPGSSGPSSSRPASVHSAVGSDFNLRVPAGDFDNPEVCAFPLHNTSPGQLLDLDWSTFGYGIERLIRQIKSLGRRLDADLCFGINEAGLVMATFLASAQFGRCPIGYLRCNKTNNSITLAPASFYPPAGKAPTIVICDFEVKHADVIGFICRELRTRYPGASLYFAVFGAMTKSSLEVAQFDDLTGAQIMRSADLAAIFIAATMKPPGIEPPLELR